MSLRARDVRVVDAETGEMVASGVAGDGGGEGGGADGGRGGGENGDARATSSSAPWVDFGLRSASALVDLGEGELEIVEFAWDDVLNVGGVSSSSSSSKVKASRTGGGGLQLLAPLAPPAPGAMPSELTGRRPLERLAVQVTLDGRSADELMREKSEVQGWVASQAAAAAAAGGGGGAKEAVAGKMSMCVFSFFLSFFPSFQLSSSNSQPLSSFIIKTITPSTSKQCLDSAGGRRDEAAPGAQAHRRGGSCCGKHDPQRPRRRREESCRRRGRGRAAAAAAAAAAPHAGGPVDAPRPGEPAPRHLPRPRAGGRRRRRARARRRGRDRAARRRRRRRRRRRQRQGRQRWRRAPLAHRAADAGAEASP